MDRAAIRELVREEIAEEVEMRRAIVEALRPVREELEREKAALAIEARLSAIEGELRRARESKGFRLEGR